MVIDTRVKTAAVLVPLAVLAVLYLPTAILIIVFIAIGMAAAFEWVEFCGFRKPVYENPLTTANSLFVLAVGVGLLLAWWLRGGAFFYLVLVSLFWCVLLFELITGRRFLAPPTGTVVVGWVSIVGCGIAVFYLLGEGADGRKLLLALLFVVWAADIGAYYAGRQFGRRPLAASISPAKTIEGAIGGLLLAVIVALIFAMILWGQQSFYWLLVVTVVAAVSIVGDLVVSREKRAAGLKDSGRLLPGHGGLLDRIDSTLAASPVFVLGVLLPFG